MILQAQPVWGNNLLDPTEASHRWNISGRSCQRLLCQLVSAGDIILLFCQFNRGSVVKILCRLSNIIIIYGLCINCEKNIMVWICLISNAKLCPHSAHNQIWKLYISLALLLLSSWWMLSICLSKSWCLPLAVLLRYLKVAYSFCLTLSNTSVFAIQNY